MKKVNVACVQDAGIVAIFLGVNNGIQRSIIGIATTPIYYIYGQYVKKGLLCDAAKEV